MDKRIFKKCPTLGEYHGMTQPWVISVEGYSKFYNQHKESIDKESLIYSQIVNDRKKIGGDDKIHKI
jgi:hypothetical protein